MGGNTMLFLCTNIAGVLTHYPSEVAKRQVNIITITISLSLSLSSSVSLSLSLSLSLYFLPQWGRWGTGEHREYHFHLDLDNNSNDCLTQLKLWNLDTLSSSLYFCESMSLSEISDIQPNLLFLINHTIKPNNFGHYASKMAPLTLWDPPNAILN